MSISNNLARKIELIQSSVHENEQEFELDRDPTPEEEEQETFLNSEKG